jgi:hypothetical protein
VSFRVQRGDEWIEWLRPSERLDSRAPVRGTPNPVITYLDMAARLVPHVATPTGPQFLADVESREWSLLAMAAAIGDGYTIEGDAPRIRTHVPPGAIP